MSVVIVAEKPSVARDIAKVLGASTRCNGYLENNDYKVTWAIGHLVGIAEPHQINQMWKSWNRDLLPMLPKSWPLVIGEKTKSQFNVIKQLITSSETEYIICATDAGREGELIFQYIYEKAFETKRTSVPVKRLWISSLTEEAIQKGLNNLQPAENYASLADAAKARSRADWLVGMNLSRAYTTTFGDQFTIGRVQTPTLSMIVEREKQIKDFKSESYIELEAWFCPEGPQDEKIEAYKGILIDPKSKKNIRLGVDKKQSTQIIEGLKSSDFQVKQIEKKKTEVKPPLLFDLTELQRQVNRSYGFSAKKTLDIAQSLYEQKKLISYPRTDSQYLSQDIAPQLESVVQMISAPYASIISPSTGKTPLSKRFIDDSKVSDHHAIIPTGKTPRDLSREQSIVYELICRRLLMAWQEPHIYATTRVFTESSPSKYLFQSRGKLVLQIGWKALQEQQSTSASKEKKSASKPGSKDLPSYLEEGLQVKGDRYKERERETLAPARLNDASLLTAMETAGSSLDEKELSKAMKEKGLGTPATRSSIIENLIQRHYISREGKSFHALDKGVKLIDIVHDEVKSPKMTGEWEWSLGKIQKGEESLQNFTKEIESHLSGLIGQIKKIEVTGKRTPYSGLTADSSRTSNSSRAAGASAENHHPNQHPNQKTEAPLGSDEAIREKTKLSDLNLLLKNSFGFDKFRPGQEEVCRDVVKGHDTILVMPTGAGKSLCYQLPGLAASGITLVISPLIALMEDQVSKLKDMGHRAECLHSGLSREKSREVCVSYLSGHLDYLFVAPERLGVNGFVSMLAKRKPTLIAIDEAHCISQWGHDFRPDYRMLQERLQPLRPANIIATTATATPRVQKDIVEQLGLTDPKIHARGFRRTNLMIEAAEISKTHRYSACLKIFENKSRMPAIIYAPTRKQAEEYASGLSSDTSLSAAPYHAGMSADKRTKVQHQFINGSLDVVVATVAFGMGIDKADVRTVLHLAFPSSIEGYYQEIGRAGRDGELSRAIMFYSYADFRTHEFFHKKNYPESKVLEKLVHSIGKTGCARDAIEFSGDRFELENYLEKLWVHGAISIEQGSEQYPGQEMLCAIDMDGSKWISSYEAQRNHASGQFAEVSFYAENKSKCRMLQLMSHFADRDANGAPCGVCDVCAPDLSILQTSRALTPMEISEIKSILSVISTDRTIAAGPAFRSSLEKIGRSRSDFERYINFLVKENFLVSQEKTFYKDGRDIAYKVLNRTNKTFNSEAIETLKISDLTAETSAKGSKTRSRKTATRRGATAAAPLSSQEQSLYQALKTWRVEESRKSRTPAFRILGDRSLHEIAQKRPGDEQDLLDISGIGPAKFKKYGKKILSLLESI